MCLRRTFYANSQQAASATSAPPTTFTDHLRLRSSCIGAALQSRQPCCSIAAAAVRRPHHTKAARPMRERSMSAQCGTVFNSWDSWETCAGTRDEKVLASVYCTAKEREQVSRAFFARFVRLKAYFLQPRHHRKQHCSWNKDIAELQTLSSRAQCQ